MNNYTLGSLFDGSGGFPLAGSLCGIEPKWAAEVEPYPIAVTRSRFPNMKHLGDISKVNGAEIEPVDIITFGSPCQDLSVAGKRAGLKHEANGDEETTRSGLFMEAVRIIKEMRGATNGKYPRFALWENVPGAFSSNKGEDFRIVCEELIKIVEPDAVMPGVPKNGWAYADSFWGNGWSLAYRVFDAQYWGVPQRRRRIHLILDLGGNCARKVLFERPGLRGHFTESGAPWQAVAGDAQNSIGANDREGEGFDGYNGDLTGAVSATLGVNCGMSTGRNGVIERVPYTLKIRSGCEGGGKGALWQEDKSATLATNNDQYLFQPVSIENHPADSRVTVDESGKVQTLTSRMGTGGGNVPMVMEPVIDVEMEVAVRKHEVDSEKLTSLLRSHKGTMTNREIAEKLQKPLTMVEHWFRTDKCFAVPDPDVWHPLKKLLGIDTDEFDQCVTEFEFKGGNYDMRNRIYTGDISPTLTCGSGNNLHLLPEKVFCLQGNGIDRADTAGCNGKGWKENTCYTLNTVDRPAVAYGAKQKAECLDVGFFNSYEDTSPTLLARGYKDPHLVAYPGAAVHYIVRRLTPTECARLQGFADRWGDVETRDDFTEEEHRFWMDVRNTHAAINGKAVKEYTKQQMLTWYNKLHTDSAEYKMWGNGIALPPALYCMQGIVDALT